MAKLQWKLCLKLLKQKLNKKTEKTIFFPLYLLNAKDVIINTNIDYILSVLKHPAFQQGKINLNFLNEYFN